LCRKEWKITKTL